jgi:hypothetical protein
MSQTGAATTTSDQDETRPGGNQAADMKVDPTREHQWLQKWVGEWTYETEASMEEGKPPQKFTGTERVRAIGDIYIQGEGSSTMPDGSPVTTQITLGYDPAKKRFVGSWLGTMMSHFWVYEGELSADGKTLTLSSEGPSMTGEEGKYQTYRDTYEFKSDDLRTLTATVQGADGAWTQFMQMDYHRKK